MQPASIPARWLLAAGRHTCKLTTAAGCPLPLPRPGPGPTAAGGGGGGGGGGCVAPARPHVFKLVFRIVNSFDGDGSIRSRQGREPAMAEWVCRLLSEI